MRYMILNLIPGTQCCVPQQWHVIKLCETEPVFIKVPKCRTILCKRIDITGIDVVEPNLSHISLQLFSQPQHARRHAHIYMQRMYVVWDPLQSSASVLTLRTMKQQTLVNLRHHLVACPYQPERNCYALKLPKSCPVHAGVSSQKIQKLAKQA